MFPTNIRPQLRTRPSTAIQKCEDDRRRNIFFDERLFQLYGPKRSPTKKRLPWSRELKYQISLEIIGKNFRPSDSLDNLDDFILPCGLKQLELLQLMTREITPEDYDTLLKLDEGIPARTAVPEEVQLLAKEIVSVDSALLKENCGICLCRFKSKEKVKRLKCSHVFHTVCIDRWLLNFNHTCPIDNSNIT